MSQAVIVHTDPQVVKTLGAYFSKRGIEVLRATDPESLYTLLDKNEGFSPILAVIDLQLPNDGWLLALQKISRRFPGIRVLFLTDSSDSNLLMRAKVHGAKDFLRTPFTEEALLQALHRMAHSEKEKDQDRIRLPKIKMPVRAKITFPYTVLALLIILAAAYLGSQAALESVEARFVNELVETAKLSTEWMVREEDRMLGTLRLLLNTEGMDEAVSAADSETLREIALPVAINAREEIIGILNAQGENILTLQHLEGGGLEEYGSYKGSMEYSDYDFVRNVLNHQVDDSGDKFAGLVDGAQGVYFYVAGPLLDEAENLSGVILVGKSTGILAHDIREDTLAHITFYDEKGQPYASSLYDVIGEEHPLDTDELASFMKDPESQTYIRPLSTSNQPYREAVGEWKARGDIRLGLIGVAFPETELISTSSETNVQIFIALTLVLVLVVLTGISVANRISKPLLEIVNASQQVSHGNLDVRVISDGNDEVAVLAHSFNHMVDGLREGSLYRDLLGRTVSPEVRDTLRDTLQAGGLRLEGQDALATVMLADVKDFVTLSEHEEPTIVLRWLNELFGRMVPLVTSYSGVVNAFSGDALFAFFGILPTPLHIAESAYLACRAAVEMQKELDELNDLRTRRGDQVIRMGIGINTGPVTAGGLGAEDRLHYTIIGDTVNTTQRIETISHMLDESATMISKPTAIAIWDSREHFRLEPYGEHMLKGKQEAMKIYRLFPGDSGRGLPIEEIELFQ
ncbi:MAG: adenylate/guanylate cyclase domain-containing protein [Anaerolineales bacterium]